MWRKFADVTSTEQSLPMDHDTERAKPRRFGSDWGPSEVAAHTLAANSQSVAAATSANTTEPNVSQSVEPQRTRFIRCW